MANGNLKRVKLSDGSVYSIFDEGALRLNADGKLITGNSVVDKMILDGTLYVLEIEEVAAATPISNVLIQDATTGEIKKRSTDQLLEDIGGISYSMDSATGTLAFKFGRQTES